MTWLENCWQWLTDNWQSILVFFTSGQAISLVVAVISIIRQSKAFKAAKISTDALDGSVKAYNEAFKKNDEAIKAISEKFNDSFTSLTTATSKINDFSENVLELLDTTIAKVNAMLDVQSIVYSTIKDDNIRKNVSDLIVNAKFAENKQKADLLNQIDALKAQIATQVENVKQTVTATVDEVNNKLNPVQPQKTTNTVLRG